MRVRPRLTVNSVDAALDAAQSGLGVVRLFSYQVEAAVAEGRLRRILRDFEPPAPAHPSGAAGQAGHTPRKAALFIEKATVLLRARFGACLTRANRRRNRDLRGKYGATLRIYTFI